MAENPPDTGGAGYRPSARERVRDQVALYEATDGAQGGDLGGRPVIILTSIGASSGAIRKTPIMKVLDGDRYVAIASFAGATNPAYAGYRASAGRDIPILLLEPPADEI